MTDTPSAPASTASTAADDHQKKQGQQKEEDQQQAGEAGAQDEFARVGLLVNAVLTQTQERFQHMADQVLRRIDDMASRVEQLESNLGELIAQQQQPGGAGGASGTTGGVSGGGAGSSGTS